MESGGRGVNGVNGTLGKREKRSFKSSDLAMFIYHTALHDLPRWIWLWSRAAPKSLSLRA